MRMDHISIALLVLAFSLGLANTAPAQARADNLDSAAPANPERKGIEGGRFFLLPGIVMVKALDRAPDVTPATGFPCHRMIRTVDRQDLFALLPREVCLNPTFGR